MLLESGHTASNKILDVLKSRYITGLSASSWRKARPFAAPSAIFILMDHGRGSDPVHAPHDKQNRLKSYTRQ